jgi:hypothetical protein
MSIVKISIVIVKEINLEILTDLHVLSPSEYEELVSGMLSIYVCMLAPEQLDGFFHIWYLWLVPGEYEYCSSIPSNETQKTKLRFFQKRLIQF